MHLVSQEGESFDIKVTVAKMSNLVKTMIDGKTRRDENNTIRAPWPVPFLVAKRGITTAAGAAFFLYNLSRWPVPCGTDARAAHDVFNAPRGGCGLEYSNASFLPYYDLLVFSGGICRKR